MMRRRSTLGILGGAALAGHGAGRARAQMRDLTIVSWGGSYQEAQREVLFRPWVATRGQRMLEETWDGGITELRARLRPGASNWDLVQVEAEELLIGCEEGLFEPMDWPAIGGRDAYIPEAVSDCGVGAILYAFVLAWDRDGRGPAPRDWSDFFDTRRTPGRRAMRRGPKTTLEIALMADGVPPAEVYRLLRTGPGVERAFRSLSRLRDDILWWERGSEPPRWLASGEAAMVVAYNGRIAAANAVDGRNFGTSWAGNLHTLDSWAIIRGSPNRALALDFLRFAGQAEVQAKLPPLIPYGPTARGAAALLPRDLLGRLPSAQPNMEAGLRLDDRFWVANLERLTRRFSDWLGG
jgi:putative spermidine/putrescine transport system substrate-binding protein